VSLLEILFCERRGLSPPCSQAPNTPPGQARRLANCRRWGWLVSLAIGLLPAAGCTHGKAAPSSEAEKSAPPLVSVRPIKQTWRTAIEQPGQIEAFEETPIYANITGFVSEVCVDMNARVKKGDCLARMRVPEREVDVQQKEAAVLKARADIDQMRANQLIADAQVKRGKLQSERLAALGKNGGLDHDSVEEARLNYESAKAALEKTKADIEAAKAQAKVAEAHRDYAKAMLQYAALNAPFDGVVTQRNVHPGHLLKPASSNQSEPLFVVVNTDRVRIFVDVPGTEAAYVKPGTPARVRIHALKEREIAATVTRLSWALNPRNRTLRAEIELANPDEALRPGMYAFAILLVDHPVCAVPASAILRKDDGSFCYVLQDEKYTLLRIRVGVRQGPMVEVLKKSRPVGESPGARQWLDLDGNETIAQDPARVRAGETGG
jgi:HlyD family secretion protein